MTEKKESFQDGSTTVSKVIAEVIAERTDRLFGLMGNGNAHLISHLTRDGFPFTSARHESAAVSMADGYYRATGRIGAATTTYGAGFTNALTALAEAQIARIPLVLVVGDAPSSGLRRFDVDQSMMAAAADVLTLLASPDNARVLTHRAFDLALQQVRPVVLSIPYDLAETPLREQEELEPLPEKPRYRASSQEIDHLAERLMHAQRPLILAGRGAVLTETGPALQELGDRLGAVFMTSVMAAGLFDSPWDLGIAGGFTRVHRLKAARRADVVLIAGASMNKFQMRYGKLFGPDTEVLRLDNEPAEQLTQDAVSTFVRADLGSVLNELLQRIEPSQSEQVWRQQLQAQDPSPYADPPELEDPTEYGSDGRLNPRPVVAQLDRILPADRSVVMDGGHFIGWAPMYLRVPDPQAMVLVGTAFQSIGLGLGSAAGVSAARPDRTTVLFTGDGGGLMGLSDLETFIRSTRRGVIVVFNDSAYGAELHQYASRGLDDQAMLIDEVDFAAVGRAFGAQAARVTRLEDLSALESWLERNDDGVFVLDVSISQKIVAEYMRESLAPATHQ